MPRFSFARLSVPPSEVEVDVVGVLMGGSHKLVDETRTNRLTTYNNNEPIQCDFMNEEKSAENQHQSKNNNDVRNDEINHNDLIYAALMKDDSIAESVS